MNREQLDEYLAKGGPLALPIDLDVVPIGTKFEVLMGGQMAWMVVLGRHHGGVHQWEAGGCHCVVTEFDLA